MITKEIRNGDTIYFTGKSGSAAIVSIPSHRKSVLLPNKEGINIEGHKFPLIKNEKFKVGGFELLEVKGKKRFVNITLTREINEHTFITSEDNLFKYFVVTERSF
tara:strand:+ start:4201 stop:4515 length:315 start_codon:yes stop_codon:yes gene_type:complete